MKFIPNAISSKVAVAALKVRTGSPTILFAAGIVGVVGTAVLASRATLKLDDVLAEARITLDDVRGMEHQDYSESDRSKDIILVKVQTTVKIVKLYAPAIGVGVLAIGCLTGSHHILSRRNAAVTAAYAALDKGFREYRARVIDDQGKDKDHEYRYGLEKQTETETDADGNKKKVTKKVATGISPYGILFHEGNPNWQRIPEYNFLFLRAIQNMANDRLQSKGFVLLNDVYDDLGVERTQAGCVVGWIKEGDGDGFVDFGIFDDEAALRVHDFVTGREGELFLDFNVDGIVYDKI